MIGNLAHWLWNQVRPVAMKEYIHMVNDPTTIRIAILLPLIQMMLFGFAINMDVQYVKTAVFNEDLRPQSSELLKGLENTTYFKINHNAYSKQEVIDAIRKGESKIGIIIPPNYSDQRAQGKPADFQVLVDGSDSNVATQILGVASQYGAKLSQEDISNQQRGTNTIDSGPSVEAITHVLYNPDLETTFFTMPGLLGIVLLNVTLFLTLLSLVREREYGTMDQLMVTPLTPSGLVVGKMIPYVLLGFFDFNLVLAAMVLIFKVPIIGNLFLLELSALIFLASTLGMGLLISARSSNQMQAAQVAQLVVLPSILMSGFVFSIDAMPLPLQIISHCMPITYFLQVLRGIILRGADFIDLWVPVSAMIILGGAILYSSILSFKRQIN